MSGEEVVLEVEVEKVRDHPLPPFRRHSPQTCRDDWSWETVGPSATPGRRQEGGVDGRRYLTRTPEETVRDRGSETVVLVVTVGSPPVPHLDWGSGSYM